MASEDFALLLKTKTLKIYFQTFTKLETSWDIYIHLVLEDIKRQEKNIKKLPKKKNIKTTFFKVNESLEIYSVYFFFGFFHRKKKLFF